MVDSSDRSQAEFNMAVSYLNRLNTLFYIANDAAMTLDANTWMHSLMAIERELSTEMKEEEITTIQEQIKSLRPKIKTFNDATSRKGYPEMEVDLYETLHNIEINLRKVLKTSGLLMKMKADARSAIEGT